MVGNKQIIFILPTSTKCYNSAFYKTITEMCQAEYQQLPTSVNEIVYSHSVTFTRNNLFSIVFTIQFFALPSNYLKSE